MRTWIVTAVGRKEPDYRAASFEDAKDKFCEWVGELEWMNPGVVYLDEYSDLGCHRVGQFTLG